MNRLPFVTCLLLAFLAGATPARAFEPRAPECLAPAKVGGGMDLSCRLVAHALEDANLIDRPMKIEFKPGGIGAVAYNHVIGVRNQDPDLIVAASSGSALNIATKKFGRYDADAVRWLGALGADYGVIAVRRDAPWRNLTELVADLLKAPGRVTIGGGGSVGSQDWMKTALLAREAGIDLGAIRYVAFEGGGEAVTALLNGYIQVFPGDAAEVHALLGSGEVRVLAVLAEKRLPGNFVAVPTAREQGYLVDWTIWRGYYMGPQVSDEAYGWWVNTLRRLVRTEEFRREREALGLYPFSLIGEEFGRYVKDSVRQQRGLAIAIGLINE